MINIFGKSFVNDVLIRPSRSAKTYKFGVCAWCSRYRLISKSRHVCINGRDYCKRVAKKRRLSGQL